MADLIGRSDDRGQLIIITAIGLAILLTLMALALNTAVFGEIHVAQTDGSLQEERGAVQYHDSVERGVGGLIVSLNREHDEYETLDNELDDAVVIWSDLSKSEQLRDGTVTDTSLKNVTFETRIVQNESRAFTDRSENAEWVVVDDVSDVRGFEMNVSDEELVETSDCTDSEGCFSVEVEGAGGDIWQLFVYDDDGVTITVESPSNGAETHGTSGTAASLNVTNGVFEAGGTEDEFTTFLEDEELEAPYTLTYTNADNVSGTYELTVDGKIVDETIDDDERYGVSDAPRIEARIDAADISVRYRSPDLTYETEIGITPGEIDG